MSRSRLVRLFVILCLADIAAIFFTFRPVALPAPDLVAMNEVVQVVASSGPDTPAPNSLRYAILDEDGRFLLSSAPGMSTSLYEAARHNSLVMPVHAENGSLYFVIFNTELDSRLAEASGRQLSTVWICTAIQLAVFGCILWYLYCSVLGPYQSLEKTAAHIARGQFDIPLRYARAGTFGAFTESIDLLRTELARAQAAKQKAADDMKKLISDLSHDLRTPLSSIIAAAELGELRSESGRDAAAWHAIYEKGQQMQTLASNLLNAALEEERNLSVSVRPVSSETIQALIADEDPEAVLGALPVCTVLADPVRLAQIVANISSNAHKYGIPPFAIRGEIRDGMLLLTFEDAGKGVPEDELPALRLRGIRGRHALDTDGAGLGLYICDQLTSAMNGQLLIQNGIKGLRVTVALPLTT